MKDVAKVSKFMPHDKLSVFNTTVSVSSLVQRHPQFSSIYLYFWSLNEENLKKMQQLISAKRY